MNSIELLLLELLEMAETPLYSAYRWLGRQIGRQLPMGEVFRLLSRLIDEEVVYLWEVDSEAHERRRWRDLPADLEARYERVADLDDEFDPFGLSLTLGANAEPRSTPDWEVDFDFEAQQFVVTAVPTAVERAHHELGRLFPDLEFAETSRRASGDRIRITGSIRERTASA